jgi:hypothetical protein
MEQTATDAYGFISYTPAYPGGLAVASATDIQQQGIPHEIEQKLGFGTSNPLFWVLVLVLIITGYATVGFNVGLKRVFKGGLKVG